MKKEIMKEEAVAFIREWGIDPDNYISANFKQFMSGDIATDNSCELYNRHQTCLKKIVEIGVAGKSGLCGGSTGGSRDGQGGLKPPIGLRPKVIANEERFDEILQAITRYRKAGYHVSQKWLDELIEVRQRLEE